MLALGLMVWGGCEASSSSHTRQAAGESPKMIEPSPTSVQSARGYSTDLEELRASFNRDKGKVRLVTLLSPT